MVEKIIHYMIVVDWDLEFEGSKGSWIGQNLQSSSWALLDACSLGEYTGVQGRSKQLLTFGERESLSEDSGVLQP